MRFVAILVTLIAVTSFMLVPVRGLTASSIIVDEGAVVSGSTYNTYSNDGESYTILESVAVGGAQFKDVIEPNADDAFTQWLPGGSVAQVRDWAGYDDTGDNCNGADSGSLTNPTNARYIGDNVWATAAPGQNVGYCDGFTAFEVPLGAVASAVTARVEYHVSSASSIATLYIGARTGTGVNCALQSDATEPITDIIMDKVFTSCATWSGSALSGISIYITMFRGNSAIPVTFSIDSVQLLLTIPCEPHWLCLPYSSYPAHDGAASYITVNQTPASWIERLELESANATLFNANLFTLRYVNFSFAARANTTGPEAETLFIALRAKNGTSCFESIYRGGFDGTAYSNIEIPLPLYCENTPQDYWRAEWTPSLISTMYMYLRWLSPYENGISITATAVVFTFSANLYSLSVRAEWSLGESRVPTGLIIDCTEAANDENYTLATKGATITWVCDGEETVPLSSAHLTSDFRVVLWINDTSSDTTLSTIFIDHLDVSATGEDDTGTYSWIVFIMLFAGTVGFVAFVVARIRGVI